MPPTRVHILTTYNSPNSLAFNYPLLFNKAFFKTRGIGIRWYGKITAEIYNCDIALINSKYFRQWHAGNEDRLYSVLSGLKKKIAKVLWFDTSDSTGATQFNVMPYIDGYYKSQLLKDRSLYYKVYYGYRIFTDYYKNLYNIEDDASLYRGEEEKSRPIAIPLCKEHEHKLHLSWHSGMNDWGLYNFFYGGALAKLRMRLPFGAGYTATFTEPGRHRPVEISARIGLSHSRDTIKRHREAIVEKLKKFNVDSSRISRRRYFDEIKRARIAVSPFGWGEICYRDFEAIIGGALLYKADMSHLETWPPIFAKDDTYVAYSWDLHDFERNLEMILKDKPKIAEMSRKAQKAYSYYLFGDGRMEFCERVLEIIG